MSESKLWRIGFSGVALAALIALGLARPQEPSHEERPADDVIGSCPPPEAPVGSEGNVAAPHWRFAVDPKALSPKVERALDWLVAHQLASGGWGQGEESGQMGNALEHSSESADVADSCMAALALVRSGAVAGVGARGLALARAVEYVCGQIEESDAESLFITSVRGTRVQMKIGTYVDTFLASMLLSELKGSLADAPANERVERALAKVLAKIERNQREDGGFEGAGWAPVLAQSMAGKGINRAFQAGAELAPSVNAQNADFFVGMAEAPAAGGPESGVTTAAVAGAAGVPLYSLASNLSGLSDYVNSSAKREQELDQLLAKSKNEGERARALEEKDAIGRARDGQKQARAEIVTRLDDRAFVAGFGSNGGEEFLSYMNVSESLVVEGGDVWQRWDRAVTDNLNRVQNEDGSWSGHHCITGRTFVTSAALLTLMADRTPVPVTALEAAEPAGEIATEAEVTEVVPVGGDTK